MSAHEQTFHIDGERYVCPTRPGDTLLDVMRDRLNITSAKKGCGRGECGACTVLVGERPVLACVHLAAYVAAPVETAKGLADESRAFREALADRGGFQCSYCTPGIVVRAVSLLREGIPEADADLRRALIGNLCRCTGYQGIVEALRTAGGKGAAT